MRNCGRPLLLQKQCVSSAQVIPQCADSSAQVCLQSAALPIVKYHHQCPAQHLPHPLPPENIPGEAHGAVYRQWRKAWQGRAHNTTQRMTHRMAQRTCNKQWADAPPLSPQIPRMTLTIIRVRNRSCPQTANSARPPSVTNNARAPARHESAIWFQVKCCPRAVDQVATYNNCMRGVLHLIKKSAFVAHLMRCAFPLKSIPSGHPVVGSEGPSNSAELTLMCPIHGDPLVKRKYRCVMMWTLWWPAQIGPFEKKCKVGGRVSCWLTSRLSWIISAPRRLHTL